ncbi:MAG: hypothetical protein OXG39_05410 [Chloroflexi bacterium]|nr:hypothetical protein [Chloroflexota bacterium]
MSDSSLSDYRSFIDKKMSEEGQPPIPRELRQYTRNRRTVYWTEGFIKQARSEHVSQSVGNLPVQFVRNLADWMTGQDRFWDIPFGEAQQLIRFVLADYWEIEYMPLTALHVELTTVKRLDRD